MLSNTIFTSPPLRKHESIINNDDHAFTILSVRHFAGSPRREKAWCRNLGRNLGRPLCTNVGFSKLLISSFASHTWK